MFKAKSLESILSTFTKTVEDLANLIKKNSSTISSNNIAINALVDKNCDLQDEIDTAANVKDKLTKLVTE